MIRFVDIGDQITLDGTKQFAWYDTVRDEWLQFGDNQAWDSWKEFEEDFRMDYPEKLGNKFEGTFYDIERYKGLFGWKK